MGDWRYGGSNKVTGRGKITIPERLFDDDILDRRRAAYWAYEKGDGFLIVSNDPLEKEMYVGQGHQPIGTSDNDRLLNIPKQFFSDYRGSGRGDRKTPVPEHARVKYHQRRFFAYRDQMRDGNTRSCYVFTQTEFDNTIGDDDWADPLSEIPRFS